MSKPDMLPTEPFALPTSPRRRGPHAARRRARQGAYVVEFAICAGVFFMVIFAGFELARYMYLQQAVDQSAYEAAREGVILGAQPDDVRAKAEQLLSAYGVVLSTIEITPEEFDEDTPEVTVEIRCDYAANSWITPNFVNVGEMLSVVTLDLEYRAALIDASAQDDEDLQENEEPVDI